MDQFVRCSESYPQNTFLSQNIISQHIKNTKQTTQTDTVVLLIYDVLRKYAIKNVHSKFQMIMFLLTIKNI